MEQRHLLFVSEEYNYATYWLDVAPNNPLPQPLSPLPILLFIIQFRRFGC